MKSCKLQRIMPACAVVVAASVWSVAVSGSDCGLYNTIGIRDFTTIADSSTRTRQFLESTRELEHRSHGSNEGASAEYTQLSAGWSRSENDSFKREMARFRKDSTYSEEIVNRLLNKANPILAEGFNACMNAKKGLIAWVEDLYLDNQFTLYLRIISDGSLTATTVDLEPVGANCRVTSKIPVGTGETKVLCTVTDQRKGAKIIVQSTETVARIGKLVDGQLGVPPKVEVRPNPAVARLRTLEGTLPNRVTLDPRGEVLIGGALTRDTFKFSLTGDWHAGGADKHCYNIFGEDGPNRSTSAVAEFQTRAVDSNGNVVGPAGPAQIWTRWSRGASEVRINGNYLVFVRMADENRADNGLCGAGHEPAAAILSE